MLFADFCTEQFAAQPLLGRKLFLSVDASANPNVDVQRQLDWPGEVVDLLTLEKPNWADTASPVLIEVPDLPLSKRRLATWVRLAGKLRYANSLTFIESELAHDALSRALSARLHVQITGGMAMLLRLFDNRVMEALLSVLRPDQIESLLAPGLTWCFAGRDGTVRVARNPNHSSTATLANGAVETLALSLTEQQEHQLLRLSEPDNIVGVLLQDSNPELLAMLPHEQHAVVAAHLQAADHLQIEQTPDRVAFVAVGLRLGEGFENSSPWSEKLVSVSSGSRPFLAVLAEVLEDE
jgi:hypothetical protein